MSNVESPLAAHTFRWPHRVAVTLCCATFPLIWVGGLVTTYDAGMAVPDWPTTYGYNLFAYPWTTWLFGPFDLFIEHGHRLLGAVVGFLAIGLLIAVCCSDGRLWMRYGAGAMLALVMIQGVFGGLRVRLDERSVAMIHACLGLATFAFAAAMATVTSQSWQEMTTSVSTDRRVSKGLLRLAVFTAAIAYVQVILGALLRHIPVAAAPGLFRVNVWFHVICGLAVVVHALLLAVRTRQVRFDYPQVGRRCSILGLLVVVQFVLGLSTWVMKYGWPAWFANVRFAANFTIQANSLPQALITTLHMAVGALILSVAVVVAIRLGRLHYLATWGQLRSNKKSRKHGHEPKVLNGERAAIGLTVARNSFPASATDFA